MLQLRKYQDEAVQAVHGAKCAKPVVVLPTGGGKTLVFSKILKDRGGRALILAHRDELLRQAEEKLRTVWPEVPGVGIVKAERDEQDAQVVLGSVQTLRGKRLESLRRDFKTVVVDEVHHAAAAGYKAILEHIGAPLTVGFTATPERFDGKSLGFDEIVYSRSLFWMIAQQYLSDIKAKQVSIRALNLREVKVSGGDYSEGALGEAMEIAAAPKQIAEALARYAPNRPTLVFTPIVAMAHLVKAELQGFAVVHGEQNSDDRRGILKAFAEGRFKGVVNCGVLLEGYDEPRVSCVAIARPTKSRVLYQQMVGRGTRLHPEKQDLLVLDFVGATTEHDLVTLATLLGVREEVAEAGVAELIRTVSAKSPEVRQQLEGVLQAETIDLVNRKRLHWIKDAHRWLLSAGLETLALVKEGDLWAVRSLPRGQESRKLFSGLTLEYAQGAAEDYIRKQGVEILAMGGAKWRNAPATQAQLDRLREWKVPHLPGITKGDASDLMTRHLNRRRW